MFLVMPTANSCTLNLPSPLTFRSSWNPKENNVFADCCWLTQVLACDLEDQPGGITSHELETKYLVEKVIGRASDRQEQAKELLSRMKVFKMSSVTVLSSIFV